MSKKEELLWLADEFSKHAPGPFLRVWVWHKNTNVTGLWERIEERPGRSRFFGIEFPARWLGVWEGEAPPTDDLLVDATCCVAAKDPEEIMEELFARAASIASNDNYSTASFWIYELLMAAFKENASPFITFSKGPSIVKGNVSYGLRETLSCFSDATTRFPKWFVDQHKAIPRPWLLYAEHKSPFLASAFLCRQLAQEEIQAPASSGPAAPEKAEKPSQSDTWGRVVQFFTGLAEEKLFRIVEAIEAAKTADAALQRLEELQVDLRPFTAEKIGWLIGRHKTAIVKTEWWKETRGQK